MAGMAGSPGKPLHMRAPIRGVGDLSAALEVFDDAEKFKALMAEYTETTTAAEAAVKAAEGLPERVAAAEAKDTANTERSLELDERERVVKAREKDAKAVLDREATLLERERENETEKTRLEGVEGELQRWSDQMVAGSRR